MYVGGSIELGDERPIGVAKGAVLVPNESLYAVGAAVGDFGGRPVETGTAVIDGGRGHALREAEDAVWVSANGGVVVGGEVEGGIGGQGREEGPAQVGLV